MINNKITNRNERNKISFYSPLEGEHSLCGKVTALSVSPGCFYLSSNSRISNKTGVKTESSLSFSLPGEKHFYFKGSLEFSEKFSSHVFLFDHFSFEEDFSKLLINLRKSQHIDICLAEDVEATDRYTGFSELNFLPEALPNVDEKDIDPSSFLLGRRFSYPFFITGMTGGIKEGGRINENLAENAVRFNIPMGLGSQRMALEHPEYESIFVLKDKFPDLFLFGNVGFSDLLKEKDPVGYCQRAIDMVQADAFAIHLNALQECVQVEGNRDFKGFLKVLEKVCENLSTPIIVKEVGSGITPVTAKNLESVGVKVLDIGGRGGTSWSQVESFRGPLDQARLGRSFRNWGAPTAFSLGSVKQACPEMEVTATGGFRDGTTIAKACALGASSCGLGLPLFKAAVDSKEAVRKELSLIARELEITMLISSSKNLSDLKRKLVRAYPLQKEFFSYLDAIGISRD